jgi:hypothetical protein
MLQQRPFLAGASFWLLAMLVLLSLQLGCDESAQSQVQTEVAKAAQTAIAEGQKYAATQVPVLKETAAAAIATQAAQLKQTAEAELATRLAPKTPTVKPEVQSAREKLKALPAMQSHWSQVNAPIQGSPGQRSAAKYADVIDQFDVDSAALAGRYKPGGAGNADPRCNIFAGDVMRAMGVPLPTKGNLGKGQGDPGATYTDPMTAQATLLSDYFNFRLLWVTSASDKGKKSDWVEIKPTTDAELGRLIAHVNAGKPAVASDSGHIAVIRPNQPAVSTWKALIIAQAGASNFLTGPLKTNTYWTPQFFIHD